jgi:hypothetical protein
MQRAPVIVFAALVPEVGWITCSRFPGARGTPPWALATYAASELPVSCTTLADTRWL